jgi:Flp pilus assembly protein CpaB
VGVNRTLDVRMAQSKPRVESEAIFVALRSLPQGSPVTVWDVALRDWPKAMMPATALRAKF